MKPNDIVIEVTFEAYLNSEDMPSPYSEPDYLKEVVSEAVNDAMYDLGIQKLGSIRVEIEGLE